MRILTAVFLIIFGTAAYAASPDWDSPYGIVCPWKGLKEAGIGWVRCGAGATSLGNWGTIEAQKGTYTWDRSDKELKDDIAQGLIPLPILGYTPTWASSGDKGQASAPPKDLIDYAKFVDTIVTRYKGSIPCWEIWNEPDISFWTGTIDQYTDLLKTGYTAAKNADPNCVVLFGGTAGVNLPFIERAYQFGAGRYFDVMAVHPYQWGAKFDDQAFVSQLTDLRRLMNAKGDSHKEIWLTELGWSTGDKGITDDIQARLLTQSMTTALSLHDMGVTRTFWFSVKDWGGPGYGIYDTNGGKKPSYTAYSTLTKTLKSARYAGKLPLGDGICCHVFTRRTGAVILVIWADELTLTKIPATSVSSQIECFSYLGEKVQIKQANGNLQVWAKPEPLFIVRHDQMSLKNLEKPAFPPFVKKQIAAEMPPQTWVSVVSPDGTSRPYVVGGGKSEVKIRVQNQSAAEAKGQVYVNLEGISVPKPLDYVLGPNTSKVFTVKIDVPAAGLRGLAKLSLRATANGQELPLQETTARIASSPVIEFLANSTIENRYLYANEGSGCTPSVRFNGTWTYKFDLSKAKYARIEVNVGANQAKDWKILASNDNTTWKTVLSGQSNRSWQKTRLDEFAGKPLYLKFEGNDQQLEELILYYSAY